LRANGSRECAPDDRLREAIRGCETKLDCFVAVPMLDHDNRVRDEFTRQAETFSASAAITGAALTQRFIDAWGEAVRGSVLDVAREAMQRSRHLPMPALSFLSIRRTICS
jgi:hypothetical protein